MNKEKIKALLFGLGALLINFVIFFAVISFVVTCSFLLFFSAIELSEDDIRAVAPMVFFNVFVLAALFVAADLIRRRITVDNPTRSIKRALHRMMKGDFSARVTVDKAGRFGEIAKSINLLAEELSSVETLRSDFIANVSHELKTPLSVINNYGIMLSKHGISEEERIEYAKAITESSRRLASLVTNILKLNKLENQQIFPSVSQYDLGEQLCECLLAFEDSWEEKRLKIETDIEEGVTIDSDSELLSLVWNNLFSNAVKFTDHGGKISLSLKSEGEYAIVSVGDSGCGMTAEVGAHIFEKFYQGDTSHAAQGNGLGLALVKKVVDIMRGEIRVDSVYGEGTTFTVKFRRTA